MIRVPLPAPPAALQPGLALAIVLLVALICAGRALLAAVPEATAAGPAAISEHDRRDAPAKSDSAASDDDFWIQWAQAASN